MTLDQNFNSIHIPRCFVSLLSSVLLPRLYTHRLHCLQGPGPGSIILQSLLSEDYIGPARDSMKMMNRSLLDDCLQPFAAELKGGRFLEPDSFPDSNRCSFMLNFGALLCQIGLPSISKGLKSRRDATGTERLSRRMCTGT